MSKRATGAWIVVAAILCGPATASAAPLALKVGSETLPAASCGVRRTLWIEHYGVVLYLPGGDSAAAELIDPAKTKAMRLTVINRAFMPTEIPAKWRTPMEQHFNARTLARAETEFRRLAAGDRITFSYVPGAGVNLWINNQYMGHAQGHALIDEILRIWADGAPLREKLSRSIRRNPCPTDTARASPAA